MCGFTLVVFKNKKKIKINKQTLRHRGPDKSKFIYSRGINLRHWRLSIVDLSKNSDQPLENEKFLFAYNGEIYDYKSISKSILKKNLNSDTLTLFSILNKSNNLKCLKKFSGFYSYVYFDKKKNNLVFSRDVLGKKFLYFYQDQEKFIISSEEKGILNFIRPKINSSSITEYLFFKNLFFGKTYFDKIKLIPPGCISKFDLTNWKLKHEFSWNSFYKRKIFVKKKNNFEISNLLNNSIKQRNICDVKTQLALSSGFDSNLILEKILLNKDIKNFYRAIGVGFDTKNNENFITKKINKNKKFYFKEVIYNKKNILNDIKKCIHFNDGPLEHPNYVGIDRLCKEARKKGKVLLSGEGADDLFFGYDHYKKKKISNSFAFRDFFIKKSLDKILNNKSNKLVLDKTKKQINYNFYRKLALSSKINSRDLEVKTHMHSLLKRNDKIGMKNSIEIRCPFLDYTIISKIGTRSDFNKKNLYKKIFKNKEIFKYNKKKIGFFVPTNILYNKNNYPYSIKYFNLARDFLDKEIKLDISKKLINDPSILWVMLNIGIFVEKNYEK